MKNIKKILAVVLAAGMVASFAITANAEAREGVYDKPNGNKYFISYEAYYEGELSDKMFFKNDENNRPIEIDTYAVIDGEDVCSSKEYYVRDENGRIIERTYKYIDQETLAEVPEYKDLYEYNANGDVLKETEYSYREEEFVLARTDEYTYDAENKVTSKTLNSYNSKGNLIYSSVITYTYDANGKLVLEKEINGGTDEFQTTYTYNEKNQLITKTLVKIIGVSSENRSQSEYSYSADGLTVTEIEKYWEDDQYINNEKYIEVSDANGNLLSIEHYEWNDFWEPCCKTACVYDEFGNVLETEEYYGEDGVFVSYLKTFIKYGTYEVPTTSPKTADVAPVAVALTSIIALGALVISKKVKA